PPVSDVELFDCNSLVLVGIIRVVVIGAADRTREPLPQDPRSNRLRRRPVREDEMNWLKFGLFGALAIAVTLTASPAARADDDFTTWTLAELNEEKARLEQEIQDASAELDKLDELIGLIT